LSRHQTRTEPSKLAETKLEYEFLIRRIEVTVLLWPLKVCINCFVTILKSHLKTSMSPRAVETTK